MEQLATRAGAERGGTGTLRHGGVMATFPLRGSDSVQLARELPSLKMATDRFCGVPWSSALGVLSPLAFPARQLRSD